MGQKCVKKISHTQLHHQQPELFIQCGICQSFYVVYTKPSECCSRNQNSSEQVIFSQSSIVQFDPCELWPQSLLCSWQEGNPVWSSAAVAGLCCFAFRDALLYTLVVTSRYSSYSHCALTSVINKTFLIRQHVVQKNPRRSTE